MSDQPHYRLDENALRKLMRDGGQDIRSSHPLPARPKMAPRRLQPARQPVTARPHPVGPSKGLMSEFVQARRPSPSLRPVRTKAPAPVSVTTPKVYVRPSPRPVPTAARPSRSNVLKRQVVKSPTIHKTVAERGRSKLQLAMTSLALLIFMVGVWVCISTIRTNHSIKSQVSALAQQSADSSDGTITGDQVPSETKPKGKLSDYRVAPDLPRFISIPKLQVKTRILRLGVSNSNELKTPANIYDTGWYDGSAKPGEAGAMLLDGHINGASQPGVFYGLKKLVTGDEITIERGDGQIFKYQVVSAKSYPKDQVDMNSTLVSAVPGKQGLNIITCDGKPVAGKTFTYDHRLVVYAVRVN